MQLIGLTGGVGMGKSVVSAFLARKGIPLADTDEIAREVVERGSSGLAEIRAEFGPEVINRAGELDRSALAAIVFRDAERRKQLEKIIHPRIRETWLARAESWKKNGAEMGVVVIPLLFETGAEKLVDRVICVACSKATQEASLYARGWSHDQIAGRLDAQWPVGMKIDRSDGVIWNEAGIEICEEQAARLLL